MIVKTMGDIMEAVHIHDLIFKELDRLGCSVNQDSYMGLNIEPYKTYGDQDPALVRLYAADRDEGTIYKAKELLDWLEVLEEASLLCDDKQINIWELINPYLAIS